VLGIVLDDVTQMLRAGESTGRIFKLPRAAITVRIRRQVHARRKGTLVVAIATAEKADNPRGFAVIAAPEPDKLEFPGDRFGETEGGLNRFCSARKELNVGDTFRQQLADKFEKTRTGLGREATKGDACELLAKTLDV